MSKSKVISLLGHTPKPGCGFSEENKISYRFKGDPKLKSSLKGDKSTEYFADYIFKNNKLIEASWGIRLE